MTELLAVIGLVVQGGAWLRRWLRFTEPYHQAKFETALQEMAIETRRRAAELAPVTASSNLYGGDR